MKKKRLPDVECFPKERNDSPLPEAMSGSDILQEISEGMAAIQDTIKRLYNPEDAGKIGRNKKNLSYAALMNTQLRRHVPDSMQITTFGQLNSAYKTVREIVRPSLADHHEYPDKGMDELIKDAVRDEFLLRCKKLHKKIHDALMANADLLEEQAQKARLQFLMKKLPALMSASVKTLAPDDNGIAVLLNEVIHKDTAQAFEELLLCTQEAATAASKCPLPLQRRTVEAHIASYVGDDEAKGLLLHGWAQSLLPEKVSIQPYDRSVDLNGTAMDAHAILMPQKLACLRERKEPLGPPEWTMTEADKGTLTDIIQGLGQGRSAMELAADGEFLSLVERLMNTRCCGGMSVMRGPVEVKKALLRLATPTPQPVMVEAPPAEAASPPPPALAGPAADGGPAAAAAHEPETTADEPAASTAAPPSVRPDAAAEAAPPEPAVAPAAPVHQPPVATPDAASLDSVKWTMWTPAMICRFLDEVAQERTIKSMGAIARISAKYGVPTGKYESWKEDYPHGLPAPTASASPKKPKSISRRSLRYAVVPRP